MIRSAPLLAEFQGQYYESLALALYRRYLASKTPSGALPTITPHFASSEENYRHLDALRLHYGGVTQNIAVDNAVLNSFLTAVQEGHAVVHFLIFQHLMS